MVQDPSTATIGDLVIDSPAFPRPNRLTNATDFAHVFKQAQRSGDRFFTVLYRRNNLGYPRLGLAIAKKHIRLAVGRNRLKRIIRESFRQAKSQLLGVDIVIMARDQSGSAENRALFTSLEQHWRVVARANQI